MNPKIKEDGVRWWQDERAWIYPLMCVAALIPPIITIAILAAAAWAVDRWEWLWDDDDMYSKALGRNSDEW